MKTNGLMLLTKIITVYSEKWIKRINTLLEKVTPKPQILQLKQVKGFM
jgi:hypothetical protein